MNWKTLKDVILEEPVLSIAEMLKNDRQKSFSAPC
jgi:hypothetical protein